jgi:hypothetical protein
MAAPAGGDCTARRFNWLASLQRAGGHASRAKFLRFNLRTFQLASVRQTIFSTSAMRLGFPFCFPGTGRLMMISTAFDMLATRLNLPYEKHSSIIALARVLTAGATHCFQGRN